MNIWQAKAGLDARRDDAGIAYAISRSGNNAASPRLAYPQRGYYCQNYPLVLAYMPTGAAGRFDPGQNQPNQMSVLLCQRP